MNAVIRSGLCLLTLSLAVAVAGCGGANASNQATTIRLGAYSVVREAFHDALLPTFAALWRQQTGEEVRFEESYTASGAQTRAIASGFDADVAVLSHEGDMDALVKAERVAPDWRSAKHGGMITNSVVAIGFRDGNPKGIKDWDDLGRTGIGVLYADPKTSGGARWNINAIYGAAKLAAASPDSESSTAAAREQLTRVQANVVNMDSSGRQSMANFAERGIGDAVVTYENELLLRGRQGKPIPFLIPDSTLLIESPAAIVESSVERHGNREIVEAFLEFLHSEGAQQILADYGFRPVDRSTWEVRKFARPKRLFTMADLGGWEAVEVALYGPEGLWTTIFDDSSRGR